MTEQQLREALAFYTIEDTAYLAALIDSQQQINRFPAYIAAFQAAADRLFTPISAQQSALWHLRSLEELFGCVMPPLSADLLLLSGYLTHSQNFVHFNVDPAQQQTHRFRVRQQLGMGWPRKALTITNVLWGSEFSNLRLVELGRLQYEFHNGDRKSAFSCVNIHIPPEGRLEPAAVRDSLTAAGPYIRQIYGIDPDEFRCKTWLLSNQIRDLYRPDSNLAAFRKMFGTITDGTDCTDEVIGYLFHCPVGTALAELPAETSLQRAVKQRLLQGSRIQIGEGILREYPPL